MTRIAVPHQAFVPAPTVVDGDTRMDHRTAYHQIDEAWQTPSLGSPPRSLTFPGWSPRGNARTCASRFDALRQSKLICRSISTHSSTKACILFDRRFEWA